MKAHKSAAPFATFHQTGWRMSGKTARRAGQIFFMAVLASLVGDLQTYAASLTSPIQVAYQFVHDSSGTHPGPTSTILLGFNQGDEAYLYALSAKHALAYHGRWSYANGQMLLSFGAADFKVGARFALRLADEQVTMPFQVLSSGPGQSYWQKAFLPIESAIFATYNAALADDSLKLSSTEAVMRAYANAEARVQVEAAGQRTPATPAGFEWFFSFFNPPVAYAAGSDDCERVSTIALLTDAITVTFACGPPETVVLDMGGYPLVEAPLGLNTLSSDPRCYLDPASPGDASADPLSKSLSVNNNRLSPADHGRG